MGERLVESWEQVEATSEMENGTPDSLPLVAFRLPLTPEDRLTHARRLVLTQRAAMT